MADLFRESTVGQIINKLSGGSLLSYDDQKPGWKSPRSNTAPASARSSQVILEKNVALEEGSAQYRVDWYNENDQDNPMNWSLSKRITVLGLISLLTTSVYIGSAI
jgi:DHA1 family multidrug resistance protein-like MFS transporter